MTKDEIKARIDALHSDFVHTSGFYSDSSGYGISKTKGIEMDEEYKQDKLMKEIDIANKARLSVILKARCKG